jgi:hypothetical protein
MSQATTLILLSQTPFGSGPNLTGEKQPAASYYLGKSDLQTLTWNFTNVSATVVIQASLSENPTNTDWFNVYTLTPSSTTELGFYNLSGNFVWLKANITNFTTGVIQYIKVSY